MRLRTVIEFQKSAGHSARRVKRVIIHTDGGCHGNPGPGGWAAILVHGEHRRELSGGELATTNNRMEIQAAIAGLSALKESCDVVLHTDSQYLRRGITEWIQKWKRKGWITSSREPVKNADLWKQLDQEAIRHRISWQWLKGHAGHVENERCDQLAAAEVARLLASHSPEEMQRALEKFREDSTEPQWFAETNSRDA